MMIDPSNSSNISSHEKLLQEYRRECDKEDERLLLSCYRKTEQGVINIKEWKPPSTIDLLKEVQSSDTLSDALSDFVQYLIDQEVSSIPVPIIQKSVIVNSRQLIRRKYSIQTTFLKTPSKIIVSRIQKNNAHPECILRCAVSKVKMQNHCKNLYKNNKFHVQVHYKTRLSSSAL